jgi:hypothetical protein
MDALLDFDVGLTLDGKKLSKREVAELLAAGDGLVLIKGKWVEVDRDKLSQVLDQWTEIKGHCAGQIDSLVVLLQGSISKAVMEIVSRKDEGLFPSPREITLNCSCPDWATMCKHVAVTLYGVGVRLDHEPELLFILRGVDPIEMVEALPLNNFPITRLFMQYPDCSTAGSMTGSAVLRPARPSRRAPGRFPRRF